MESEERSFQLNLVSTERKPETDLVDIVLLHTNAGIIHGRLHAAPQPDAAVIWVGGAGGGLTGPAGGLYPQAASILAHEGVGSLRLDYRHANNLISCVLDVLMGVAFLQALDYKRVILAGHSFGGAVVITTAAQTDRVIGVIALSSQNAGTEFAAELSPRSVLLLHGAADPILPDACSRDIYFRANSPKQIEIYPGCGHNLDECRDAVEQDVLTWIRKVVNQPSPV